MPESPSQQPGPQEQNLQETLQTQKNSAEVLSGQPTTTANPLVEATTDSLNVLFSRDPLGLKDSEIATIVAALRAERAKWDLAEASGKKRAPTKASAQPTGAAAEPSLKDLGLA